MSDLRASEAAFETVIEAHLLANGYVAVDPAGFDRERAIFPETVLAFIRETQPKEWAKLEALHGDKTGEQVLGRPVQVDGYQRLAGDAASWLQVLRPHPARGVLQGRPRPESGTGGALRRQPPGHHPAAALPPAHREVAGRGPQPERHPRRHRWSSRIR